MSRSIQFKIKQGSAELVGTTNYGEECSAVVERLSRKYELSDVEITDDFFNRDSTVNEFDSQQGVDHAN
jgi:hypothetical protein